MTEPDLRGLYDAAFPKPNGNGAHEPGSFRHLIKSARELMSETPTDIGWVMRPIMAEGAVTLLAGTPKYGKTEYALGLASAIIHGTKFCGHYPARRGPVIYLTEMDVQTLNPYLARHHMNDSDHLHVMTFSTMVTEGASWDDALRGAVEAAIDVGSAVVIVDTFSRMAGLIGEQENSSGAIMEKMVPLYMAKQSGLSVMLTHHTGKAGDGVDAIRGSSAIAGEVDHILLVRKPEGGFSDQRVRVVEYLGRLGVNETRSIRLEEDYTYSDLGLGVRRKMDEIEEAILDVMPRSETMPMSRAELMDILPEYKEPTVKVALAKMVDDDILDVRGRGKGNDPFRYWVRNDPARSGGTDTPNGMDIAPLQGLGDISNGIKSLEHRETDTTIIPMDTTTSPRISILSNGIDTLPDACSAPDLCARMGLCKHAPHCPDVKSR
jgi:hypothetical protein